MAPRYKITLTSDERKELERISSTGKRAARTIQYARALLLLDAGECGPGWRVAQVAEAVGASTRTLEHLKKKFVEEGLSFALERKKRIKPPREIQFGGEFEAKLLALACSPPPTGKKRWTIRLLAEKVVELKIVPTVSTMTVCSTLKKTNFSLTEANTGRSRRTTMRLS